MRRNREDRDTADTIRGRSWIRTTATALVALVTVAALATGLAPATASAAPPTASGIPAAACTTGAAGFSHSYLDPYWFTGKSDAQVRSLLEAQKRVGIDGVILQWTAYQGAGSVVSAYPASPTLGFRTFNDALPRLISATRAEKMELWVGLLVAPNVFSTTASLTDSTILSSLSRTTTRLADDIYAKYGSAIHGWYLPIEPNDKTIQSAQIAARQGSWIGGMTSHLHQTDGHLPVMSSPSMPTAILAGKTAEQFVDQFAPVMASAGVDVWNFQDGYKMTAWSPATEVAALLRAQHLATADGAELWATVYTPGPGADGKATVSFLSLKTYLTAIGHSGIRLSEYMFAAYLNPDPSLPQSASRASAYESYAAYCGARST